MRFHGVGKMADAHPPLRPDAPKPAISRSTTTTRSEGSRSNSVYAVQRPVYPAPTMATSASSDPGSDGRGVSGSPAWSAWSCHRLSPA